jgi:hypothetical protein
MSMTYAPLENLLEKMRDFPTISIDEEKHV